MASYLIKRDEKTNEIVYMSYDFDGYKFKPKNKNDRLSVNNVMIVKPAMIEKILYIKFNKIYLNISNVVLNYLASDDEVDDGTCEILLGEVDRIRSIYLKQYEKYLRELENIDFLEKLNFLYKELEIKQLRITKIQELNYDYDIERGKSR